MVVPYLSQSISSLTTGTAAGGTSLRISCARSEGSAYFGIVLLVTARSQGCCQRRNAPMLAWLQVADTALCFAIRKVLGMLHTSAKVLPLNVRTFTSWRCFSDVQSTLSLAISRDRLTLTPLSQKHPACSVACAWHRCTPHCKAALLPFTRQDSTARKYCGACSAQCYNGAMCYDGVTCICSRESIMWGHLANHCLLADSPWRADLIGKTALRIWTGLCHDEQLIPPVKELHAQQSAADT